MDNENEAQRLVDVAIRSLRKAARFAPDLSADFADVIGDVEELSDDIADEGDDE